MKVEGSQQAAANRDCKRILSGASLGEPVVRVPLTMQGTQVRFPVRDDAPRAAGQLKPFGHNR